MNRGIELLELSPRVSACPPSSQHSSAHEPGTPSNPTLVGQVPSRIISPPHLE